MATSANGHNLTVTSGHILIFLSEINPKGNLTELPIPHFMVQAEAEEVVRERKITSTALYSVGISLVSPRHALHVDAKV